jgi:hypothetical protein
VPRGARDVGGGRTWAARCVCYRVLRWQRGAWPWGAGVRRGYSGARGCMHMTPTGMRSAACPCQVHGGTGRAALWTKATQRLKLQSQRPRTRPRSQAPAQPSVHVREACCRVVLWRCCSSVEQRLGRALAAVAHVAYIVQPCTQRTGAASAWAAVGGREGYMHHECVGGTHGVGKMLMRAGCVGRGRVRAMLT